MRTAGRHRHFRIFFSLLSIVLIISSCVSLSSRTYVDKHGVLDDDTLLKSAQPLANSLNVARVEREVSTHLKVRRVTLLYYTNFFSFPGPPHLQTRSACSDTCFVTSDHDYASVADAFIVHGRDYKVPDEKYARKPWIFHCHENPAYTPVMQDEREMSKFTYSTSARLDSDFPMPVWWGLNLTGGRGPDTRRAVVPFAQRQVVPIYVASTNCEPVRTEYQKQLMDFIDIDSYGRCLHNKDGLVTRDEDNSAGNAFKLQRQYKFTLVFMNADCDLWVDPRLLFALDAGSVPIFMGTEDVNRFLPGMEDSIIKVSDFKSPRALASYVKKVSDDEKLYNTYLSWKKRGVDYRGTEMEAVSTNLANWYCNVCDQVRADPEAHPGRVKAEQCTMRKTEDWLPTPKHYDPKHRPSVHEVAHWSDSSLHSVEYEET